MREVNWIDQLITGLDLAVRTVFPPAIRNSKRPSPDQHIIEEPLCIAEKKKVAALMRVNHTGEVCAQALYQGQALTAQLSTVKQQMAASAEEENDHLAWCEQRLRDLNSHPSVLNPLWYMGSLIIGALAGIAGDRFSLGFVAETEKQVSAHLKKHLCNIPIQDCKTRVILEQMDEDETHHAAVAKEAGAMELPSMVKQAMRGASMIMTNTSYYF